MELLKKIYNFLKRLIMALNTSGPISLAGTIVGQSIQEELDGNGTTQISLNDTNVRNLAGVVSGQITMPTNFWGKSNAVPVAFWFANSTGGNSPSNTSTTNAVNFPTQIVSKESSLSYAINPTTNTSVLLKRNLANGNYLWGAAVGTTTNYRLSNVTNKTVVDSLGNTYILMSVQNTTTFVGSIVLVKVSTSGSITFRKSIRSSTATGMIVSGFCIDASDNLYIYFFDGVSAGYTLLKLASDGTTVLSSKVVLNTAIDFLTADSNQNVYAFESQAFVKWNPTQSAMLFRKQIALSSPIFYNSVVAADGSIFITGRFQNITLSQVVPFMAKLDSNGNTLWAKTVNVSSGLSSLSRGTSIALDENGNSYFGGAIAVNSTGTNTFVMKFASDGTLIWQRSLVTSSPTTNFSSFAGVSIGLTDPLSYSVSFLSGNPNSNFNTVLLPQDGTKTGNLVSGGAYQYLATSYSVVNLSLTFTDLALTTPTAGPTMVIADDTIFTQTTSYTGTPTNSLIP